MNTYLLFKSIHLIAVISWMAGLLYLPRIFVYHSESIANNKSQDLISELHVIEKKGQKIAAAKGYHDDLLWLHHSPHTVEKN